MCHGQKIDWNHVLGEGAMKQWIEIHGDFKIHSVRIAILRWMTISHSSHVNYLIMVHKTSTLQQKCPFYAHDMDWLVRYQPWMDETLSDSLGVYPWRVILCDLKRYNSNNPELQKNPGLTLFEITSKGNEPKQCFGCNSNFNRSKSHKLCTSALTMLESFRLSLRRDPGVQHIFFQVKVCPEDFINVEGLTQKNTFPYHFNQWSTRGWQSTNTIHIKPPVNFWIWTISHRIHACYIC